MTVMGTETLPRERRGKSYDLRPLIEELHLGRWWLGTGAEAYPGRHTGPVLHKIFMRLTAREGATGRPEEVLDSLGIPFEETRIERTKLIFIRSQAD